MFLAILLLLLALWGTALMMLSLHLVVESVLFGLLASANPGCVPAETRRRLLVGTSCLFATVVAHAYALQHTFYFGLYLALLVSSLAYRAVPSCRWLLTVDGALARAAFVACVADVPLACERGYYELLYFPVCIALLWCLEEGDDPHCLHALLHVHVWLGMHCWLACLYT